MLESILVCAIACLGITCVFVVLIDDLAGRHQITVGRGAVVASLLISTTLVSCSAMVPRSVAPNSAETIPQTSSPANGADKTPNADAGATSDADKVNLALADTNGIDSDGKPSSEPAPSESEGSGEDVPPESALYTPWSESESPNYVRLIGDAQVTSPLEPGRVIYSDLDTLGRTQQVRACITSQMMDEGEARKRGDMPNPAGWPRQNFEADIILPTGKTYHGWFWNRCHLLAKSLGGNEEIQNLVTGTRMLNVGANDGQGGMDMFETAIRSWLSYYPDVTVQYVATPIYEGDELICRSVIVDVLSSDGALNERLEVYNTAKGYEIDYSAGTVSNTSE